MQIMSKFSSVQCIISLFVLAYPLSSCLNDFSFLLKASQSSKSALHFMIGGPLHSLTLALGDKTNLLQH